MSRRSVTAEAITTSIALVFGTTIVIRPVGGGWMTGQFSLVSLGIVVGRRSRTSRTTSVAMGVVLRR